MALDSYVVSRLCSWARWASHREDGGIGYPKQCAFTHQMPHGGSDDYSPEINEACVEMNLCVIALSIENNKLYCALYAHYRRSDLAVEVKAQMLNCCKQTFYNKVDQAHRLILGWLNDRAAGIEIPVLKNNVINFKKTA